MASIVPAFGDCSAARASLTSFWICCFQLAMFVQTLLAHFSSEDFPPPQPAARSANPADTATATATSLTGEIVLLRLRRDRLDRAAALGRRLELMAANQQQGRDDPHDRHGDRGDEGRVEAGDERLCMRRPTGEGVSGPRRRNRRERGD